MGKWRALGLATVIFAVNFWAWSLLAPLATQYGSELKLDSMSLSVLLATPILTGSLLRIPLGILTDRYGGRRMFTSVCLAVMVPVAAFAFVQTYPMLIVTGLFLGIAGASFAVGVPFVNAWFPASQRGLALGLYGVGISGTAISGLLIPGLAAMFGRPVTFLLMAGLLALTGIVAFRFVRDAPGWKPFEGSWIEGLACAAKLRATRELAVFYGVSFGAFIAFGVYLPVLLKVVYGLSLAEAAAMAAGFVLLATAARPVGGWLADRFGGERVLLLAFTSVAILAFVVGLQPQLVPIGVVAYFLMALTLGCAGGAVFALVGRWSPQRLVGSVTGIVGAAGGLGGFFPPLIMGACFQFTHSYLGALWLLMVTAASLCFYLLWRAKTTVRTETPEDC